MMDSTDAVLMCANHPQTPTALRCNRCGKPVCIKCIVRTPVGYRCRECVRGQQQVFESVLWYDYLIAAVMVAPLAGLAGALVTSLGFFSIFLAPVVGGILAELVRLGVRRHRGRYLNWVAAGAFGLGSLPLLFIPLWMVLVTMFAGPGVSVAQVVSRLALSAGLKAIWIVVYAVLGGSTLYARLRGISIN